ncbi:MAG: D-alanine--D-alanine ligase [Desulfobulbales bacterium]
MIITVVHNEVAADDAPDAKDVLVQVETVTTALRAMGHKVTHLRCSLDLEETRQRLHELGTHLVFNLVESLAGRGSLIHLFPALLEALGLPFTCSDAEAMRLTSNKAAAKERMEVDGLPTPAWIGPYPETRAMGNKNKLSSDRTWIIKSLWEHASIGLDGNSLVQTGSAPVLMAEMVKRVFSLGGACFAEEFIEGREFNLSLLAAEKGATVLPPAEISFAGFDPEKPRIVDYQAKWAEDSFEYQNTPRSFDFRAEDAALLAELEKLALRCWDIFNLRGYARVDFRVDAENRPWILEVNANPCLSPDAGFAAALARAQISFSEAVGAIVVDVDRIR